MMSVKLLDFSKVNPGTILISPRTKARWKVIAVDPERAYIWMHHSLRSTEPSSWSKYELISDGWQLEEETS